LVDAIFLILKNSKVKGEIFNIGSGKPLKIKRIIKKIVRYYKSGKPQFGVIKLRKEEQMKIYPDIFKARSTLNWKPKINFLDGLKKTIQYYNAN
jgi:nucleoside-diphosphate-sugar epimerase